MALILAIALGLFWIIKLSYDKAKIRESEEEYQTVHDAEVETEAAWREAVTDKALEMRLEDGLNQKNEALLDEYNRTVEQFPEAAYGKPIRVLMANRGKLTYDDSLLGLDVISYGSTLLEQTQSYERSMRFAQWVADRVKKPGFSDALYFDGISKIVPLEEPHPRIGKVKWAPMISEFQIKHTK